MYKTCWMLVVKHQAPWQHTRACQRGSNIYSKSGLFIKPIILSFYDKQRGFHYKSWQKNLVLFNSKTCILLWGHSSPLSPTNTPLSREQYWKLREATNLKTSNCLALWNRFCVWEEVLSTVGETILFDREFLGDNLSSAPATEASQVI